MNALIGSGFCSLSDEDHFHKVEFLETCWLRNIGVRDIVIVDNTDRQLGRELNSQPDYVRIIRSFVNIGHVGSFLKQFRPHLLGWSLSWILPALVAYSEKRDFIYFEADCLAFGDWEKQIIEDMEKKELSMAFGEGSRWACCEQSLFYIKWEFITEAIWMYLSIPEGDGMTLPENKFEMMEGRTHRVGRHSLLGGRNRPLPFEEKTFYGQKFSKDELDQLKVMGRI